MGVSRRAYNKAVEFYNKYVERDPFFVKQAMMQQIRNQSSHSSTIFTHYDPDSGSFRDEIVLEIRSLVDDLILKLEEEHEAKPAMTKDEKKQYENKRKKEFPKMKESSVMILHEPYVFPRTSTIDAMLGAIRKFEGNPMSRIFAPHRFSRPKWEYLYEPGMAEIRDNALRDFTKALKSGKTRIERAAFRKKKKLEYKKQHDTIKERVVKSLMDDLITILEEKHKRKFKDDTITHEKFKFRRKKGASHQILIGSRAWNSSKGWTSFFKSFKQREHYPEKAEDAVRVHIHRDEVSFCFTQASWVDHAYKRKCEKRRVLEEKGRLSAFRKNKHPEKRPPLTDATITSHHRTCSLDCGVRVFQTIYDADGQIIEWGKNDIHNKIYSLCRITDKIKSSIAKEYKIGKVRAYHRYIKHIKNKITECHHKLALFLCENYKVILIPKFKSSEMVLNDKKRKFGAKTARAMLNWGHYKFRELLKAKALHHGAVVIEVDEYYTSKQCDECGHVKHDLTTEKTFSCEKCGHVADRDAHAARGILLRFLTNQEIPL